MDDARPDDTVAAGAAADPAVEFEARLASLKAAGAAGVDAVQLRYLEALAARSSTRQGRVRQELDAKLQRALQTLEVRVAQARAAAGQQLADGLERFPQAAVAMRRHFEAGDFAGLQRLCASLDAGTKETAPEAALAALVRRLERSPADGLLQHAGIDGAARVELRTVRHFRNTWSKLSTDKQVARALAQAPSNAGPINSHMLVLRSLALMRDISPDYLNRFISYADTLLCLEQAERDKPASIKRPAQAKSVKK